MNFVRIQPYKEDDEYLYWICGIYKIVSYEKGKYYAYFIQEHQNSWGDLVSSPPYDGGWKYLKDAKKACEDHRERYKPSAKTIRRAKELKIKYLAEAE